MALAEYIQRAECLESMGQWRRAAQQWLVVYDKTLCEVERENICRRRDDCMRRSRGHQTPTARSG
ncbi:PerC family transcriptional regulator [Enterobacter ludwigii]|uniref:PerC family transcriptional regulator n=1 Tax=Enterobacter ludwigii TaxID=299767 RepID=UPI001BD2E5BC|nr:PerC family transcriptional regulator [Enterobacter hormaechei]